MPWILFLSVSILAWPESRTYKAETRKSAPTGADRVIDAEGWAREEAKGGIEGERGGLKVKGGD
jgi:hypothetical protein